MKALQLRAPRTFEMVELDPPQLDPARPGQLLLRARFVSMCGSDLPFFTGGKPNLRYPLVPGAHVHECVGKVVASNSDNYQPGDTLAALPDRDAGLAEFFLADASRAVRLPASLEMCGESTLIQPLSTVLFAIDQLGSLEGRAVAVVGLGAIGLMFCRLLRQGGAAHILGIDPLAYRCTAARQNGATRAYAMPASELALRSRASLDGWVPPDLCIEAVGHQMQTLNDCIQLVRPRGEVLAFGVPDHPAYTIEFEAFFRKNGVLRAVVTPPWAEYLEKARDLFLAQREELAALVTHRFPIQAATQAFELYERRTDGILKALLIASFEGCDE
jgi:L-iditol 2-dehydrogenase